MSNILKEFKAFAMRGNVIDLAIGVVIGGAFGKIVASLVDNIIMPFVGMLLQGKNFSGLKITSGEAVITYGLFIQTVIDFIIIAFVIFLFVKMINSLRRKEEAKPAAPPAPTTEEKLLMEIRDLLKARQA